MITISVLADFGPQQRMLNELKKGLGDKVMMVSLNETIRATQTQVTRAISTEYNITQKEVRDRIKIVPASAKGQRYEATLYGKREDNKWSQNIARFLVTAGQKRRAARASRIAQAFGGRVSFDPLVRVRRGGSPVPVKGAFVLNVAGQPIVHREGGRLRGVQTVGVPQMFSRPTLQKPILQWIPGKFAEIFDRRMRYFVSTIK